jgi:hypothetical protein
VDFVEDDGLRRVDRPAGRLGHRRGLGRVVRAVHVGALGLHAVEDRRLVVAGVARRQLVAVDPVGRRGRLSFGVGIAPADERVLRLQVVVGLALAVSDSQLLVRQQVEEPVPR